MSGFDVFSAAAIRSKLWLLSRESASALSASSSASPHGVSSCAASPYGGRDRLSCGPRHASGLYERTAASAAYLGASASRARAARGGCVAGARAARRGEGRVRAVVDRTFPLARAAEALAYQRAGRCAGKVVVVVVPDEPAKGPTAGE